jgi:imidazolonepropionase-like amidohydrolase
MKNFKNYIVILVLLGFAKISIAQNPIVSKQETGVSVFINARIFVGNGTEIQNGTLVIEKGIIKLVSEGNLANNYPNAKITDLKGKHIYPGIISPNNTLGLTEIEAVRTTSDYQEIGQFNPNIRSLIAYNTDSEIIPTVRSNGVLITQATPEGGIISGRSSIMNLDGWNYEDAALKVDDGLWLNWPSKITTSFDFTTFSREKKKNENYDNQINEINTYFSFSNLDKTKIGAKENLKYDAIAAILNSNARLYIRFESDKEALDAISFIKKNNIKNPVLAGAVSSDLVCSLLKDNNIPILIPTTHRIPDMDDSDLWQAYKLPKRLMDKGILVGMYYNESYWRTRNLPFAAGNAAGHGLTRAQALQMITLNNAKILGVDKLVGSLEAGKKATFVISEGDILDMKSSKVEMVYINGANVNLDDKQKRLAKKYQEKYNIK